ncbi:MAG: ribonuclease R [Bacilli bacterium]|nr:ribonuclease R [Bacilli bacterium]
MKDKILEVLSNVYEAKTMLEINNLLNLNTVEEYQESSASVGELVNEHIIYHTNKDKYILYKNCPGLKIGKLSINKKGFGFVLLTEEDDLFIPEDKLNNAIDDDLVLAEITRNDIKKEGRIIRVLERNLSNVVGEIVEIKRKKKLKLDNDKLDIIVELDKESLKSCVDGHKVLVKLIKEIGKKKYLGKIIKILGHKADPGVDILSIAYKYGINDEFSEAVKKELERIPDEVSQTELVGRRDLTGEEIFTIDGDDTKDIDDAISIKYENGLYELGVHIADVSNYVKDNTALGQEAYDRGTSSYLADTVIPMIPHKLSNGICSLNEGVIRLTMSCVMKIDHSGKVVDYDIFPSYIKSRKKMTYKKVNDILMRNIIDPDYEVYASSLYKMNELAHILRRHKIVKGYIDFDLDEAKVVQDETGKAIDIVKRIREDGECLIEDFMIVANETVASHISNMDLPFIYRVHGEPNPDKIDDFVNLVKQMGYTLNSRVVDLSPKGMQKLLGELNDKPEFKILSSMLLRSMKKAEYSKENIGHFGLASREYTHFTSPIRRFPDLTVHRLLKSYLVEHDLSMSNIKYWENSLAQIAEHSSEREVAAVNAERDVMDMKMAEYMEDHIGEQFDGVISTVTNFGFFVELENMVEGLVHVNNLKGDYYNYVPELLSLIGETTKKQYRIGDKVRIEVIAASKENAMIDFKIVEVQDGNKE